MNTAPIEQVEKGQWIRVGHRIGQFVSARPVSSLASHFGATPIYDRHIEVTLIGLSGRETTAYLRAGSPTVDVIDAETLKSCRDAYNEARA